MEKDEDKTLWLTPLVLDQGFSVQFRGDHVHVELGKNYKVDPELRRALWEVVRDVCEKNNSRRALVEGNIPIHDRDTADLIDAGKMTATVPKLWLAFCLKDFEPTEETELYEVIAASQGVRVKFFSSTEQALTWLRKNTPA